MCKSLKRNARKCKKEQQYFLFFFCFGFVNLEMAGEKKRERITQLLKTRKNVARNGPWDAVIKLEVWATKETELCCLTSEDTLSCLPVCRRCLELARRSLGLLVVPLCRWCSSVYKQHFHWRMIKFHNLIIIIILSYLFFSFGRVCG